MPRTYSAACYAREVVARVLSPLCLALVCGCSERNVDPTPPPHRSEACESWCRDRALDPQCPSASPGRTLDACVADCVHDRGANWTPDGNGEDLCGPEQVDLFACEVALTCDEREDYQAQLDALPTAENSYCTSELIALFTCAADHTD